VDPFETRSAVSVSQVCDWRARWGVITSTVCIVHSSAEEHALLGELSGGKSLQVLGFLNAHALNLVASDPSFFAVLRSADILLRDGSGMAMLYRWLGRKPGLNMNGTDFIPKILAAFAGRRVAFWGSREPHLDAAAARCAARFGAKAVSCEHGFHEDGFYVARAVALRPDLIILGMGMPKQERVAYALRSALSEPSLIVCAGALLDFLGGKVPRAPLWMRALGIEWAYRLLREPKRLFTRYAIGNPIFLNRVRDVARANRYAGTAPYRFEQPLRAPAFAAGTAPLPPDLLRDPKYLASGRGLAPPVDGRFSKATHRAPTAPTPSPSPRIAYLVNQYPKVSHSFIRREILALEQQGFDVQRLALRGWDATLVDDEDVAERKRTRYVLQGGVLSLLIASLRTLVTSPARYLSALRLAAQMGWRAARPLPYHLIYLAEACRMLPWLKSFGATHVHAHFGTNSAEILMLAHALGGPPYSFTVHGADEVDDAGRLGFGEKARRAAFLVAVSSYGRSQLFRWIRRTDWDKVRVVRCGLDSRFYDVAPLCPPTGPRLVCVGRICAEKGQLLLIDAVRQLTQRGVRLELVLVGDGEMRGEVEALIARYQLGGTVRMAGWLSSDAVRAEILAARALVLPSFIEGLPVVLMEAMALRRPVLTTYVAGIPELVRSGQDGWLIPAGDVDALAAAIADCLARSPEELRIMGDSARARALERHSIESETAKLAELFRSSPLLQAAA
jgi:exopolysaccharide biosynthesis WecB/TagA/CpsF family protein